MMMSLVEAVTALTVLSIATITTAQSDLKYPNETLSKLAFGSCHKRKYVNPSAPTIWHKITEENPDAFVWTGDSVYPPTRGVASVELLQEEYRQMAQNKSLGYATFHPHMGIYGTWDDQ